MVIRDEGTPVATEVDVTGAAARSKKGSPISFNMGSASITGAAGAVDMARPTMATRAARATSTAGSTGAAGATGAAAATDVPEA